jgi:hypothetical protein
MNPIKALKPAHRYTTRAISQTISAVSSLVSQLGRVQVFTADEIISINLINVEYNRELVAPNHQCNIVKTALIISSQSI